MLGTKAKQVEDVKNYGLKVTFKIKPSSVDYKTKVPLPEFGSEHKKLVQFHENPEIIEVAKAPRVTMNATTFHNVLGHACEDTTRIAAKSYIIHLTNKFNPCKHFYKKNVQSFKSKNCNR